MKTESWRRFFLLMILPVLMLAPLASSAAEGMKRAPLQEKYLEILETGVDFFEPIFTESLTDAPDSGFYDIRQYGNWTHPRNEPYHTLCIIPANGQVVLSYAVLLKYSNKAVFGNGRYPREILYDHLRKAIRWICLTSTYVENPYDFLPEVRSDLAKGRQWHRRWGLRQDLIGYLSLGIAILWDDLDTETQTLFQKVATGVAVRGRLSRTATPDGNGNHDQVKQDFSSTIAAAYLFPEHPEHEKFWQFIEGAGLDMVSTLKDFGSEVRLPSGIIKNLAQGANYFSDYSSLHHNHPSIWYGIDKIFEGRSYVELMAALTNRNIPETFTYKGNGFDGIYNYALLLSTNDGILNHLRNPEYDSSYGAGLLAFCYGVLHKRDSNALALEQGAANVLARHIKAIGQYDYHRGSLAKAAMAFLWHQYHDENRTNQEVLLSGTSKPGSHYLEYLNALIHRSSNAWVGFVWGTNNEAGGGGPGAYVMPAKAGGPLIYNTSDSLIGSVLAHRPFWFLCGLIFLTLLTFLLYFTLSPKNRAISEIIFAIANSFFISTLFIFWIDLFHTIPERIPSAVVPILIFPVISALASLIFCSGSIIKKIQHYKFRIYSSLVALLIVPLSLLLMVRNPASEMLKGITDFENISVFIVIHVFAIFLIHGFGLSRHNKYFVYIGIAFMLISSFGILGLPEEKVFYLRLVSIRNIPRIAVWVGYGSAAILSYGAIYFWKTRKVPVHAIPIFLLLIFSTFSVAALSFGRFDLLQVKDVSYEASDTGFSTAGLSRTSHSDFKQAFFTYDSGLSIVFVDIIGRKNGLVSWSGVPVPFYQRNGYVSPRIVVSQNGNTLIPQLLDSSNWWCVGNMLGGVYSSKHYPLIMGEERVGANWARSEDYLDRINIISMAPRKRIYQRDGGLLEQISVAVWPNTSNSRIREFARSIIRLDGKLAKGWRGAFLRTMNGGYALAVANLSSNDASAKFTLFDAEWVPVFSMPGEITVKGNKLNLHLKSFHTHRDISDLAIKTEDGVFLAVQKERFDEYRISADSKKETTLRLRWTGGPLLSATLKTVKDNIPLAVEPLTSEEGLGMTICGENRLSLTIADKVDLMPPFVHIETPVLNKNNLLEVVVTAKDQSGLASVTLFMNDQELSMKDKAPFVWTIPVQRNVLTFYAVAVDGAMTQNRSISFSKSWVADKNRLKMVMNSK